MLLIPISTVRDVIKKFSHRKSLENLPRTGASRKTSTRDGHKIVREVKKNRKISAKNIKNKLPDNLKNRISVQTVRNWIIEKGYHGRIGRKTPFVNSKNIKKRLDWGNKYISKPLSFWNKVI